MVVSDDGRLRAAAVLQARKYVQASAKGRTAEEPYRTENAIFSSFICSERRNRPALHIET